MQQEYNYTPLPEPIPITEQVWPEGTLPLVCTSTLAYNHEPYIRECLDGILMQKTTFPVQVLVHEDCSTDRTAEILKEYQAKYPNLIKVFYQPENIYSLKDQEEKRKRRAEFNSWRVGKYVALCEGDDYWIDPLKLQKQVDFLEANPEYSLSHTSKYYYYEDIDRLITCKDLYNNLEIIKNGLKLENLLSNYDVQTLTVVIRASSYFEVINNPKNNFLFGGYFLMGDTQLWFELFKVGKFHFLTDITGVYRKQQGSSTKQKDITKQLRFKLSSMELRIYLCSKNDLSPDYNRSIKHRYHNILLQYLVFNKSYKPLFPLEIKYVSKFYRVLHYFRLLKCYMFFWLKVKSYFGMIYRKQVKSY